MSEKMRHNFDSSFMTEVEPPEPFFDREAQDKAKEHIKKMNASDIESDSNRKIKELTTEYNGLMEQYEKAMDEGEEALAETFIQQANKILERLNKLDPQSVVPKSEHAEVEDSINAELERLKRRQFEN